MLRSEIATFTHGYTRRRFLAKSACLAFAAGAVVPFVQGQTKPAKKFRAAVFGHTGRGDYGHGLDLVFTERPDVELLAIADPVAAGRVKAAERSGAARQYEDYRELLAREKPELVSVAPRWTDQHHALALAALHAGAHVLTEKPFTETLRDADDLLEVAKASGRKIAVAHQMRLAPQILFLKQKLQAGMIGDLLEMRAHGKQDQRAGGEDLLVLGLHLFHLMRFFAGDARWCSARVLQRGREITPADAHPATEGIGLIAGDEIVAQFGFDGGVHASFTSRARNRQTAGPWGIELVGSKGAVRIHADICPRIFLARPGDWNATGQTTEWRPIDGDPSLAWNAVARSNGPANQRVVDNWLSAIQDDREPACSGNAAMRAIELAHAVFAAGLSRGRVTLPLTGRDHPLRPKSPSQ